MGACPACQCQCVCVAAVQLWQASPARKPTRGAAPACKRATHTHATPCWVQGTGVLVVDRINGVAYVALSERADKALAEVGWGGGGVGCGWARACGRLQLLCGRLGRLQTGPVAHTLPP